MNPDRSRGAQLAALVALALLAGATLAPWFVYEFNSGRQTPPGGPQPESETGIVTRNLTIHATGISGDTEPSDPALAQVVVTGTLVLLLAAAALLLLVALGEVPGVDRFMGRRVSLTLIALALAATVAAVLVAGNGIPAAMEGHGVDGVYTARLDEPDGYTRAYMHTGWYLTMLGATAIFVAGLFKFQAGPAPEEILRARLA